MRKLMMAAAFALPMFGGAAMAQETLKIGYIDPLSGGGASVGEVGLKTFQFLADEANAKGGILGKKVEIVPLDNKTNPQESLIQAQKAIDAGVRYLTQGNGSSVAGALSDFVTKYNERNPGKEVLYFNYAAVDPVLTNAKCSFWHFRWDANSDIKMEALTNYMKTVPSIKNVYLINQDYSFGEAVRSQAKAMLAAKRPDIKIVGDELHPLLKITDFAPYIAKIKASGADTVVTGNWGQDFALLLKAAADAGLKVNWYTYYAGGPGGPTAVKQANLNHQVFQVGEGIPNLDHPSSQEFEKAIRAKYDFSLFYPRAVNEMRMLAAAADKAKSVDPVKVAARARGHGVRSVRRRQGLHAQGRSPVLPADLHFLARRTHRKESRSTRKRPAGAGSSLRRSTLPRPCFRPPARWNGRTDRSRLVLRPREILICRRCTVLELIVISALNGVLFGMLLFLMASGLTVIFSMLGVLNFAHASFYMLGAFFGFQISRWFGFWPALLVAPLLGRRDRRRRRALRPAARAQKRPCRRTAVHLRSGVRDRGSRADHLGQEPGGFPCAGLARFSGVYDLFHQLSRLQDVHAAGFDRDLRKPAGHAQKDADRPDRTGSADAPAYGGPSRPQCRTHLHAGVRRRHRARRGRRRHCRVPRS